MPPALSDQYGRPVDIAALKTPAAARPPNLTPKVFNPDPASVILAFKKADQGDPRDLHELAREVRRRDGHMGGQLRNRVRAVTRLPFKVEAGTDDKAEVDIAEAVKRDILDAHFFRPLVGQLLDGNLRGYAVSRLTWSQGTDVWRPVGADLVDPRDTIVDPLDGTTVRWRDPADPTKGIDIKPFTAVIHASGDTDGPLWGRGLQFALSIYYSIKRLGVAAWAAFVELYGVARPVGTYPAAWEKDQIDDFDARLGAWAHAGRLVLPNGATVAFPAPSQNASDASHAGLIDFCNSEASKAILGQTMTSDNGSSLAQAQVHEKVANWITEADSLDVCATIERDLFAPYVLLNFGPKTPVPKCRPQIEDTSLRAFRVQVLKDLVPLGLKVEQSVARDLGGFPAPAEGAEILQPAAAPSAPAEQPDADLELARREDRASGHRGPHAGPYELTLRAAQAARAARGLAPLRNTSREFSTRISRKFAEGDDSDVIDRDSATAAAEGARPGMEPIVETVKAVAAEVDNFDDFLARLREREVDGDAFVRSVATWTMQARGLGDGTDDT